MAQIKPLDIYLDFFSKDIVSIPCTQYDKDARTLIIHLLDKGKTFNLDSTRHVLLFKMTKKDNTKIFNEAVINSDGTATYVITEQSCIYAGVYDIQFMLIDISDETIIHTMPAKLSITQTVADNVQIESSNEFNALNNLFTDLQSKLYNHYFVLTEDKDIANGVPSLDENTKIPLNELYEATTTSKGITLLTDSVNSSSTTTAATPNSVKTVNDNLISEISRATNAENNLDSKKLDKTTVASSNTLGLVKSGNDITVDSSGNVSVNDYSHNHTVSNISDLTATASEINVLDGITASTTELNYTNGVTSNIQTQLNSKSDTEHTHDNRYYTQNETDTKLNTKAPLASPAFTGTPKAPTASADTNTTQLATTAFVQTATSNHNTSATAHSDIRDLISKFTTSLNALADSDDITLDQLSEIVAYIKSNRTLIENVTTNKVNVSDIVDNLTSTVTNKPLSAKQGKVLNDLLNELTTIVDTKVSGVKGNAETSYRTGNVNITPLNIGLGNVPNVATNDQTPTFTEATSLTKLTSGEKLSAAMGKISKAVTDLISHLSDTVKHITSTERTNWNAAKTHADSAHAPSNAQANVIETIKVNGSSITPTSKSIDITIPTKTSQLINDNGYKTTDNNTTYSLNKSGTTITLTGSDGSTSSVTDSTGSNGSSVSFTRSLNSGTKLGTITIDGTSVDMYAPTNTDTHYTTGLKVGASATATANATATNGNVYLNVLDNATIRDSHKIVGSGATTVTSDSNGVITISSTDTNTVYSAGTGISLSGTTFSNSGVRSISTGNTNGTISVDTDGTNTEVSVKGLGSAAYTNSSAYASANHTHTKLGDSTVGSGINPIYLNLGTATASSSTIGNPTLPVYIRAGTITSCTYPLRNITTSLTSTATNIALTASAGKSLQDQINKFNIQTIATYAGSDWDDNACTIYYAFKVGKLIFISGLISQNKIGLGLELFTIDDYACYPAIAPLACYGSNSGEIFISKDSNTIGASIIGNNTGGDPKFQLIIPIK